MLESSGLSDVCISALPMPSNENESKHQRNRLENREKQRGKRDDKAEKHRLLASDAVHQHTRRYGEDEEPEEPETGNMLACESVRVQVGLHVVGGDARKSTKPMAKKQKHDRKELCQRRILSIFHAT